MSGACRREIDVGTAGLRKALQTLSVMSTLVIQVLPALRCRARAGMTRNKRPRDRFKSVYDQ